MFCLIKGRINEETSSIINYTSYLTNIIVHILIFGFTGFVTYVSFAKGVVLFSWHPPLMLIGVSYSIRCTFSLIIFCSFSY